MRATRQTSSSPGSTAPPTGPGVPDRRGRWRHPSVSVHTVVALLCTAVPLGVAFLGPLVATPRDDLGVPSTPGGGYVLGTDFAGRDVLYQVLTGGALSIGVAVLAVTVMYCLAVPLGIASALTRRRAVDEALMRPLDIPLAIPSLLLVITVCALWPGSLWPLLGSVVAVGVAEVARMTRAHVLELSGAPVIEAMRLGGQSWWQVIVSFIVPRSAGVLAASAGLQFTSALALVSTASFLGVGLTAQTGDWATMVEENRGSLLIQPWPVVLPSVLIALLVVGVNLLAHNVSGVAADTAELSTGDRDER